jgi:DNA-nicking Smr family endonuclease
MKNPLLTEMKRQLKTELPVAKPITLKPMASMLMPELSEDQLFARAMQGAQRIHAASPPARPTPRTKPSRQTLMRRAQAQGEPERERDDQPLSDTVALMASVEPETVLGFHQNGLQPRQFEQLKLGKLPWQTAVDLHGCTLDQAREAVLNLLDNCQKEQLQVAKIVHGKGLINGQAVLKSAVNGWLKQLPQVLAFSSAPPREGGTGAVLLLLKRDRQARSDPRLDKPEPL